MKRVIDGLVYDVDTSTALAVATYGGDGGRELISGTLYQTKRGAFFVQEEWEDKDFKVQESLSALTAEKAREWVTRGVVDLLPAGAKVFSDLPEA